MSISRSGWFMLGVCLRHHLYSCDQDDSTLRWNIRDGILLRSLAGWKIFFKVPEPWRHFFVDSFPLEWPLHYFEPAGFLSQLERTQNVQRRIWSRWSRRVCHRTVTLVHWGSQHVSDVCLWAPVSAEIFLFIFYFLESSNMAEKKGNMLISCLNVKRWNKRPEKIRGVIIPPTLEPEE